MIEIGQTVTSKYTKERMKVRKIYGTILVCDSLEAEQPTIGQWLVITTRILSIENILTEEKQLQIF